MPLFNSGPDDFPRSDHHRSNFKSFPSSSKPKDEQLFKSRKRLDNKQSDRIIKKNKNRTKKDPALKAIEPSKLNKVVIENMTLSRLIENMTIYGCIQEVGDFEIKFSTNGGILLCVPITNISDAYSKLIENFANDSSEDNTEIAKLTSLFQIGEYYPIKIVSKRVSDKFGHTEVIGSINPKDIYGNLSAKLCQKLPEGFVIHAAVSSKEDYGYEMDIGVADLKVFLPFDDLQRNGYQTNLSIGQLVSCSFAKFNERSITLTSKYLTNFCFEDEHEPSIYSYVPGVRTKAIITDTFASGLELSLPSGYKGFVSRFHINDDILKSPKTLKIGDCVRGHVLYVHPHTKQICISLKTKLTKKSAKHLLSTIKQGLVIENATLCSRGEFGTTLFKLPADNFGIAFRKNLCEPTEYETRKHNNCFSIGSSHICRVKKFYLFDNLIEVSLKKSFIERKDLSLDDVKVGSFVEGIIKKHKKNGIYVQLGFGINGFIPNIHLSDTPFINLAKNRETLFPLKKKVRCRITRLDTSTVVPRISLTTKKSLLKLDESSLFTDINEIKPKMSSTGMVCLINSNGVLLEFFGRVRGFIPLKYLATYKIEHPDKVFSLGQLIKSTVVSVDSKSERMVCSLIDINETKKLKLNANITNKKILNSSLKVGQILKNMKIISRTPMKGFDLINSKEDIEVFLPVFHLSDDPYLARLFFGSLKVGSIIDKVMVFSVDATNVVCVTRKKIFLQSCESIVTCEDDISLNSVFPCIVRNVTNSGVFFEIPDSRYGVVRRKNLQDGFYDDPHRLGLQKGQTIFVNAFDMVLNENDENDNDSNYLKRFKFSMKLSNVWNKESSERVDMMKSYLSEFRHAIDSFKTKFESVKSEDDDNSKPKQTTQDVLKELIRYSIGQVVTYMVSNITDEFIELNISLTGSKNEKTVPGIAVKYTNFDDLKVAHMGNAVICDIDFDRKCLFVFMQPQTSKIVRQIRNSAKSNFINTVKIDQSIKGTVLYVCNRYVMASLGGHAPGVIAYIPPKRHPNDLSQVQKLFSVGEDYHFLIKEIGENVIAILNTDYKKVNANVSKKNKNTKKEEKFKRNDNNKKKIENKSDNEDIAIPETSENIENGSDFKDFQWNIPDLTPNLSKKRKLDNEKSSQNEESDLDDLALDSDSEDESVNKKRKTREERNEESRKQEANLRQKEIELSNTDRTPQNEQDFEMAIIASPDSSLVWIKFMSFYLEKGDISKARDIGERALQRISFREEKEKLNVWIGLINLENTFGDQDSIDALVARACKFNDPKVILMQLASIYDSSNKKEKAEQMFHLALKKFKNDKSVWIDFLLFYMRNDRTESARKLFQKSLLSLEKRDHVDVISKFAQLEFRYGDCEQAKTIFETMLATYWKRMDQWSIYIDMLIKYSSDQHNVDSLEYIRNIFGRLITFKFPPQKMKFVFKKYYDFEAKFSSENSEILDKIKQKALEYVECDIFD